MQTTLVVSDVSPSKSQQLCHQVPPASVGCVKEDSSDLSDTTHSQIELRQRVTAETASFASCSCCCCNYRCASKDRLPYNGSVSVAQASPDATIAEDAVMPSLSATGAAQKTSVRSTGQVEADVAHYATPALKAMEPPAETSTDGARTRAVTEDTRRCCAGQVRRWQEETEAFLKHSGWCEQRVIILIQEAFRHTYQRLRCSRARGLLSEAKFTALYAELRTSLQAIKAEYRRTIKRSKALNATAEDLACIAGKAVNCIASVYAWSSEGFLLPFSENICFGEAIEQLANFTPLALCSAQELRGRLLSGETATDATTATTALASLAPKDGAFSGNVAPASSTSGNRCHHNHPHHRHSHTGDASRCGAISQGNAEGYARVANEASRCSAGGLCPSSNVAQGSPVVRTPVPSCADLTSIANAPRTTCLAKVSQESGRRNKTCTGRASRSAARLSVSSASSSSSSSSSSCLTGGPLALEEARPTRRLHCFCGPVRQDELRYFDRNQVVSCRQTFVARSLAATAFIGVRRAAVACAAMKGRLTQPDKVACGSSNAALDKCTEVNETCESNMREVSPPPSQPCPPCATLCEPSLPHRTTPIVVTSKAEHNSPLLGHPASVSTSDMSQYGLDSANVTGAVVSPRQAEWPLATSPRATSYSAIAPRSASVPVTQPPPCYSDAVMTVGPAMATLPTPPRQGVYLSRAVAGVGRSQRNVGRRTRPTPSSLPAPRYARSVTAMPLAPPPPPPAFSHWCPPGAPMQGVDEFQRQARAAW